MNFKLTKPADMLIEYHEVKQILSQHNLIVSATRQFDAQVIFECDSWNPKRKAFDQSVTLKLHIKGSKIAQKTYIHHFDGSTIHFNKEEIEEAIKNLAEML